jgi:sugar phosphate isomerase/epimerase
MSEKYPGGFISEHLADWLAAYNKHVATGQGAVDWKEFLKAAENVRRNVQGCRSYILKL